MRSKRLLAIITTFLLCACLCIGIGPARLYCTYADEDAAGTANDENAAVSGYDDEAAGEVNDDENATVTAYSDLGQITETGNVILMADGRYLTPQDLEDAGIEYGDIVTVRFLDKKMDMPVVRSYSEVSTGDPVLRIKDDYVLLAISLSDFASEYIADKTTFEDESFAWTQKKGVPNRVAFTVTLKTKGGYYSEYGNQGLLYSNNREDYPDLTDEEFANFREITTTGMGRKTLYRTSSPLNPKHNRDKYADAAVEKAGAKTVMNLADSREDAEAFPGYSDTYYSTTNYIALKMGVAFDSADFRGKLERGLKFFAENDGPYVVHCIEGKDRAGLVSALLECFMGATYDEVIADYMVTYYNYYGIEPGEDRYDELANMNIVAALRAIFGTDDLENADLAKCAELYFRDVGLSDAEIEALRTNLRGPHRLQAQQVLLVVLIVAGFSAALLIYKRTKMQG